MRNCSGLLPPPRLFPKLRGWPRPLLWVFRFFEGVWSNLWRIGVSNRWCVESREPPCCLFQREIKWRPTTLLHIWQEILCGCACVVLLEILSATIWVCAVFGSWNAEISQLPKETKCATQQVSGIPPGLDIYLQAQGKSWEQSHWCAQPVCNDFGSYERRSDWVREIEGVWIMPPLWKNLCHVTGRLCSRNGRHFVTRRLSIQIS